MDRADKIAVEVLAAYPEEELKWAIAEALREYGNMMAAFERERCAKIAERYPFLYRSGLDIRTEIAAQIRAGEANVRTSLEQQHAKGGK